MLSKRFQYHIPQYRQNAYSAIPINLAMHLQESQFGLFKGRRQLRDQIVDLIHSGSRATLILHGTRRIGKTSFLLQLHNLVAPTIHSLYILTLKVLESIKVMLIISIT